MAKFGIFKLRSATKPENRLREKVEELVTYPALVCC